MTRAAALRRPRRTAPHRTAPHRAAPHRTRRAALAAARRRLPPLDRPQFKST
ncbi:MAG: hypothetical protein LBM04_13555 [Opitutaceae bacterium]|nr:hypothetical protein [Opitutaceae bacterium]